jgi:coproporphyrinogen III oxidase-like Fe-S oxidoreductase
MSELLTDKQIMLERLMLGLRQSKGMAVVDYLSSLSDIGRQHFYKNLDVLQQAHLVDYQKGIVRLTPQGYALENEVTLRLFSEN